MTEVTLVNETGEDQRQRQQRPQRPQRPPTITDTSGGGLQHARTTGAEC